MAEFAPPVPPGIGDRTTLTNPAARTERFEHPIRIVGPVVACGIEAEGSSSCLFAILDMFIGTPSQAVTVNRDGSLQPESPRSGRTAHDPTGAVDMSGGRPVQDEPYARCTPPTSCVVRSCAISLPIAASANAGLLALSDMACQSLDGVPAAELYAIWGMVPC